MAIPTTKIISCAAIAFYLQGIAAIAEDTSLLMEEIINARTNIHSGHVSIQSTFTDDVVTNLKMTWDILFDGDHIKATVTKDSGMINGYEVGKHRLVYCYGCGGDHRYAFHSDAALREGHYALLIKDAADVDPQTAPIPDPRMIGLVPADIAVLPQLQMRMVIGSDYSKSGKIEYTTLSGISCRRVTFQGPEALKQLCVVCVDNSSPPRVLQIENSWREDNVAYKDVLRCTYDGTEKEGTVLPDGTHYARYESPDGSAESVTREEEATIVTHFLNDDLSDNAFDLSSIETLKPGVGVLWNSEDVRPAMGNLAWNGEEIVSREEYLRAENQSHWLLYLNLGIVALVAGMILLRRYRAQSG